MIRICRDKNYTSEFFVSCGLRAPMPVNDWREYRGKFPCFIKPKDGSSSINAFRVENPEELAVYAAEIGDYIVQPFVEGTEYTIDMFGDFDGNLISAVPRIRLAVRAGEVLKTKICLDPVILGEAERLAAAFRPVGPMTVQLIRDRATGEDYYIEINPRYGGGAPLSMKAGARSAEYILSLLMGEKPSCLAEDLADGAVYSRFDQSVCTDPGRTPQQVRGVIFDLDDTLYPERTYVRSGYRAVAADLGRPEAAEKPGSHADCVSESQAGDCSLSGSRGADPFAPGRRNPGRHYHGWPTGGAARQAKGARPHGSGGGHCDHGRARRSAVPETE